MNQTSVKDRRKFDEPSKREAVNHWLASRKSAEVIAQELESTATGSMPGSNALPPPTLGGGRGGASPARPRSPSQLDAALREVRHLREQRDILKKTLGILSEPSPNAMNGSTR